MPILRLIAQLGINKSGFDAGLAEANKQVEKFGSGLRGQLASAFGAAAVISFAKSIVDTGDALDELAERLGISIQQAQQFSIASKLGGSDADFFATRFEKLRAALRAGAAAGKNPLEAFGISATTDTVSAIEQLAKVIQEAGLNAEQATKFVEIFGKGSGKLINVLGDMSKAKKGMLFNESEVANAKALSDFMTLLANDAKVFSSRIVEAFQIIGKFGLQGFRKDEWFQADRIAPKVNIDEEAVIRQRAAEAHMAEQDDILKVEAADRTLKLVKETAELQERNRIAGLSREERMIELAEEREAIFQRIAKGDEERAKKAFDLAKNEAAIISLGEAKKPKAQAHKLNIESHPGLAGVFVGAAAQSAMTALQQQQLIKLEQLHADLVRNGILIKDVR